MQLRPYQEKLKAEILNAWNTGGRNVCAVSPTGSGKTHLKSNIHQTLNVPSVCIAHRQELVQQISESLASFGITHNIIAPAAVVKFCAERHMRKVGRSYYNPNAPTAVAGVQTLLRRQDDLKQFFSRVKLWDIDECFPAGTLVDGRPIETLEVGDVVTSFDEVTKTPAKRKVVRLFKREMPKHMVRIVTSAHHVLTCTPNHPIWTMRGWVNAGDIRETDVLLHVRSIGESSLCDDELLQTVRSSVLQHGMLDRLPSKNIVRNNGANEPQICVGTNEKEQSDETTGKSRENAEDIDCDGSRTEDSRWERTTPYSSGGKITGNVGSSRVRTTSDRENRFGGSSNGVSKSLQDRLRSQGVEDSDRSGRVQSHVTITAGTGRAEGFVSDRCRVESVSILERDDPSIAGDGYVYNIEVDEHHTYTANGIVVHNCHHCLPGNQWGKAADLFPHAIGLGVTATPLRCDRKALDGVFDRLCVGPSMRELINDGHLSDYRIFCPPESYDTAALRVSQSTGEYVKQDLIKENERSTIVGDVVSHYLKIAPGKRGLTFTVDVQSAANIADAYNAAGVPAAVVTAKTPDRIRTDLLERLGRGDIKQLVNVDLFGEGMDCPTLEVVSMARPTQSYGLYVQQFGRVLRTSKDKTHGIVIDHVGNVVRHGLPDKPRDWSLAAPEGRRARTADPDEIPLTTCIECFRPYERVRVACPFCGNKPTPTGRTTPEQVDGDLIELDPTMLAQMRGEVSRIDGGVQIPDGASDVVALGIRKKWNERQSTQGVLRDAIAAWAGVRKYGHGESDREIQKRFYLGFGTDIITAQTLGAKEAAALTAKIRGTME